MKPGAQPLGRPVERVRTRGFSLAECVVAILILSTLSVVMVGVIPATMFGMKTAENRTVAATLARQALEDLKRGGLRSPGSHRAHAASLQRHRFFHPRGGDGGHVRGRCHPR